MVKSAVTVSLVEQARGGPFVFWDDLSEACAKAAKLGFDAVELFAPSPAAVDADQLKGLLDEHNLRLAAVGTGAGMVIGKLSLADADPSRRDQARAFIRAIIDMGAPFEAPAIIGSMQGRSDALVDAPSARGYLVEALGELGAYAAEKGVPLIYEPLNRYETNMANTIQQGVMLLDEAGSDNVTLLADLFHMNIEEADMAEALRVGGPRIGHIHFVDSNRRAAGMGHMDYAPIAQAIRDISYEGYLSAEAFALPNSDAAAEQTIRKYRELFGD